MLLEQDDANPYKPDKWHQALSLWTSWGLGDT